MHVDTDPLILEKLHAFGSRRRRLIILRGLCETIATLLAAMSLIALLDWLIVLPDAVRYGLSIAGYAVVLVFVWRTCLRLIVHSPDDRQLARLLETIDSRFHEDLLSAIELGQTDADYDSPLFRQMLQIDVAGKIRELNVEAALPARVVRRWAALAGFVVATCLVLAVTSNFGQLLARAMLPMANIARVSGVHVAVVEPAPSEPTVPQAEPLPIAVELTGPEVDRVTLELFHPDGRRERMTMAHDRDRRFATTIAIGTDSLEYRVLAGDAITRRYTITARPRPIVTAFEKTTHLPKYAELEPVTVSEKTGDIDTIVGSTVDLALVPDQKIKSAELRFDFAGKLETVALTPGDDGKLHATVPVTKSGLYKVHLVAAETGFTNQFSPPYEITAQPDTVPRVAITEPTDALTLPADQILSLRGEAEDDLGLAKVEQIVRVNEQKPVTIPLVEGPGRTYGVERNWDLIDLKLKPGDRVVTQLVAFDKAGHRSESNPLSIAIAAGGVDTESLAALTGERHFADALGRLASVVHAQRDRINDTANELMAAELDPTQAGIYTANLTEALGVMTDEADRAATVGLVALRQARGAADTHDLALAMRIIADVRYRAAHEFAHRLSASIEATDPERRKSELRDLVSAFGKSDERARNLSVRFQQTLAAHEVAVAVEQVDALVAEQVRINDPASMRVADEAARLMLIRRRQSVAAAQLEGVEKLLQAAADRKSNRFEKPLEQTAKHLAGDRDRLLKALASETDAAKLVEISRWFADEMGNGHRALMPMQRELDRDLLKAREQLEKTADHSRDELKRFREDAVKLARLAERLEKQREANAPADQLDKDRAELDALATQVARLDMPVAADLLRARAAAEEGRPDSDARFVADLGLTVRAITQLRARFTADTDPATLAADAEKLADAFAVIEIVGETRQLARANDTLDQLETYEYDRLSSRTRRPRQYDFEQETFASLGTQFREADLSKDAEQIMRDLPNKPYAARTRDEFDRRRVREEANKPTVEDLKLIGADLAEVLRLIEPAAASARKTIASIAPTLPESMRQAADAARKTEKQAEELAAADRDPSREPKPDQLGELNRQQQQLNEKTNDVLDALRQEANLQNTLDREQLAVARDADDAAAMIKEPADRADKAVERALDTPPRPDRADRLAEAADQHEQLADKLEQAADHFEKLAKGEDVTDSRQALREAEGELGVRSKLDDQFAQAERLADLAQNDPASLLRELEKELPKNRNMQRELDHIADAAAKQAQQQLAAAAAAEQNVAEKLDQAQKQHDQQNQPIEQRLADIGRRAEQLANNDVKRAEQQAQQAKADVAAKQNAKAADQLNEAADTAGASPAKQAQELADAANQAAEQVAAAAEKIERSAADTQKAAEAAQQAARNNEEKARAAAAQQQAEQAAAEAQAAAQKAKQAAEKTQQAANNASQAEQQAAAAEKSADAAKPGSPEQQQANQQAQQANQQAEQARQQAEQTANELTQAAREAEAAAHRAEQAAKLADQATDAPAAEALADAAQQQAAEAKADAQRAQQTAEHGDVPSGEQLAQRAAETADQLNEAAAQLKQAAADAQHAAEQAATNPDNAKATAQQAESAAEQAAAAAESAKQAAQAAQQSAESAEQAAANQPDAGAQQSADQAAKSAQAAAEKADAAAQQAAAAEQSAQAAEKSADAAQPGSPEAQQAEAQGQQAAQQAQQASQKANEAAAEAQAAANQAKQAAEQAANAAQQAAPDSPAAQQAKQSAEQAAAQAQQSQQSGEQAKAQANQSQQSAQAAQQGAAAMKQSAEQAAQQSQNAAAQAEQLAREAQQIADAAGKQAEQQGQPLADAGAAQSPIGEQVADAAADLARAARHAERLGDSPTAEQLGSVAEGAQQAAGQVADAGQHVPESPSPRAAANEVADARDAIRAQADALAQANAQSQAQSTSGQTPSGQSPSGESPSGESPSGESPSGESPSGQSPSGQSPSGQSPSGQSPSGQSPSGEPGQSPSPFDNPETGKWLARALDAADQQVFAPEQAGQGEPGSEPGQGQPGQGEPSQAQGQPGQGQPGQGEPSQAQGQPGQGQPGQGQPGQGQPSQATTAALQAAAAAQAQAMASSRAQSATSKQPGSNPISQGIALKSEGGAAATAANGGSDAGLPDAVRLSDADWGRLPPKLARDLVEARRTAVSPEYRHMVDTYFKTIAEKAREKKN